MIKESLSWNSACLHDNTLKVDKTVMENNETKSTDKIISNDIISYSWVNLFLFFFKSSSKKLLPPADGNKYRDVLPTSYTWHERVKERCCNSQPLMSISIKTPPSVIKGTCRKGGRKSLRIIWNGGQKSKDL